MHNPRTVMQQALKVLEQGDQVDPILVGETIDALRKLLSQPEPKPVLWQWRKLGEHWSTDWIFHYPIESIQHISEVRELYTK